MTRRATYDEFRRVLTNKLKWRQSKLIMTSSTFGHRLNKMTTFWPQIMTNFGQKLNKMTARRVNNLKQSYSLFFFFSFSIRLSIRQSWSDDLGSHLLSRLSARARLSARLSSLVLSLLTKWWHDDCDVTWWRLSSLVSSLPLGSSDIAFTSCSSLGWRSSRLPARLSLSARLT